MQAKQCASISMCYVLQQGEWRLTRHHGARFDGFPLADQYAVELSDARFLRVALRLCTQPSQANACPQLSFVMQRGSAQLSAPGRMIGATSRRSERPMSSADGT